MYKHVDAIFKYFYKYLPVYLYIYKGRKFNEDNEINFKYFI